MNRSMKTAKNILLLLFILFVRIGCFGQADNYLLAFVDSSTQDLLVGYVNMQGDTIIPAKYREKLFGDTLFRVNITVQPEFKNAHSSLKNTIISKPFIYCGEINRTIYQRKATGLIANAFHTNVIDGKIGIITSTGEQVIKAKYNFIGSFKNGFAPYYIGGESIFYEGSWYWDGDFEESGYINRQGQEFPNKISKYNPDGTVDEIIYRWNGSNCRSEQDALMFYTNGQVKIRTTVGVDEDCSGKHFRQIIYDEDGRTVHLEKVVNGKREGEYRIGHYDYHSDSTGLLRIYEWYPIQSIWENGVLLDFISTDVLFLDLHYRVISERKMINMINAKQIDWWYTYIPQAIYTKSGQRIRFLIHKKPVTHDETVKIVKRKNKIVEELSDRLE